MKYDLRLRSLFKWQKGGSVLQAKFLHRSAEKNSCFQKKMLYGVRGEERFNFARTEHLFL